MDSYKRGFATFACDRANNCKKGVNQARDNFGDTSSPKYRERTSARILDELSSCIFKRQSHTRSTWRTMRNNFRREKTYESKGPSHFYSRVLEYRYHLHSNWSRGEVLTTLTSLARLASVFTRKFTYRSSRFSEIPTITFRTRRNQWLYVSRDKTDERGGVWSYVSSRLRRDEEKRGDRERSDHVEYIRSGLESTFAFTSSSGRLLDSARAVMQRADAGTLRASHRDALSRRVYLAEIGKADRRVDVQFRFLFSLL